MTTGIRHPTAQAAIANSFASMIDIAAEAAAASAAEEVGAIIREQLSELRRDLSTARSASNSNDADPYIGCEEARREWGIKKSSWYGPNGLSQRIPWTQLSSRRKAARRSVVDRVRSELEDERPAV